MRLVDQASVANEFAVSEQAKARRKSEAVHGPLVMALTIRLLSHCDERIAAAVARGDTFVRVLSREITIPRAVQRPVLDNVVAVLQARQFAAHASEHSAVTLLTIEFSH